MRAVGFSTGALAKGDVPLGVELQIGCADAVELSALRVEELEPLVACAPDLDLSVFAHVSVHAPSRFPPEREEWVVELLASLPSEWPIVLHPDAAGDLRKWLPIQERLLIENMDSRKTTGRTADELRQFFGALPASRFCFDIGHALQVDRSGDEARRLLDAFGPSLVEVHASGVGERGEHGLLGHEASPQLAGLVQQIPVDAAVIIESVVPPAAITAEIARTRNLFAC